MSDLPADYQERLNLKDEIARIERNQAETQKLQEETRKFVSEQHKLMAEGHKYNRDRWILPLTVLITAFGSIIVGLLVSLPTYLRLFGWVKP